jgi:hypothetical protein
MVNLFPEVVTEGGKEAAFLNRAPGLSLLATVGTGPIRGLWSFGNFAYVASGSQLYSVNSSWTPLLLGTIEGTGPVSMSDNGTQLFIACNPKGYIYNSFTTVFAQITDADFQGAVTVSFLDGYFVFNQPNSQKVWITSLYDGSSIDPLAFASAEGSPDGLIAIIVDHREAWLFGTNSVEVWYDAGLPDFPLTRIQGAFNEIGCAAPYSVAKLDNGVFWLGADARGRGVVYRSQGYSGVRISTHAVEYAMQGYGSISDAIGYTYQQEGHPFYVLVFPTANATWVYDAATGAWHERAGFSNGQFIRHRSNCYTTFNNTSIVGDYENGKIYSLSLAAYDDAGSIQKWLRSWRALPAGQNNLKRTAQHSLQLDCETGSNYTVDETVIVDIMADDGYYLVTEDSDFLIGEVTETQPGNPQVMLRWSDDAGHTWSNEHWVNMGQYGAYGTRAIWRRLGMTTKLRDRVYEVSGTDAVKIAIMGAELEVTPTNA